MKFRGAKISHVQACDLNIKKTWKLDAHSRLQGGEKKNDQWFQRIQKIVFNFHIHVIREHILYKMS